MVSLLFFWCAYKAKEVAIFFPLILVIEEWMGERRWARVAPFMAISLCFGSQALIANRGRPESAYTLHFTISALAECLRFYVRMGLGLPWAALAFWSWLSSEERRWLVRGSLASTVLIIPLVFLPGRLFSVYLYVPLIFGTVAIGAVTNRWPRLALTVAFIVYAGMGLRELRIFRKAELTQAPATREFVESAWVALKGSPTLTHAFYEGGPKGLSSWGVEGAIRLCHGNLMMKLEPWNISKISAGDAVVRWTKFPRRKGVVEVVRFDGELTGDWYAWDGSFRWMGERARMRIRTEPGDKRLSVDLVAAPADELELMVDGKSLGTRLVANHGAQTTTFELRDAEQKDRLIEVELRARPARRIGGDPRLLGLAVRTVRATP